MVTTGHICSSQRSCRGWPCFWAQDPLGSYWSGWDGAVAGGLILVPGNMHSEAVIRIIVGGAVGFAGGLVLTGLVEWVGSAVFDAETFLFHIGGLVFLLGPLYLRVSDGRDSARNNFPGFIQGQSSGSSQHAPRCWTLV